MKSIAHVKKTMYKQYTNLEEVLSAVECDDTKLIKFLELPKSERNKLYFLLSKC